MFTRSEYEERTARATAGVSNRGLDGLVISLKEHITYLTGYVFHALHEYAFGVLASNGQLTLVLPADLRYEFSGPDAARALGLTAADLRFAATDELVSAVASVVNEQSNGGRRRLGYEGGWHSMSVDQLNALEASCSHVEWVEATDVLMEQRVIKSPAEIAVLREAARLSDIALEAAWQGIRVGRREFDVAAEMEKALGTHDSEYAPFPLLVGSGWRSGLFHPIPSEKRFAAGDATYVEVCGGRGGRYNSNACRTFFLREPSQEQEQIWEVVARSFWAGVEQIKPGNSVSEADRVAKEVRAEFLGNGWERYIPCRAGFGLELGYPPIWIGSFSILMGSERIFEPGMVVSLEPSIAGYHHQTVMLGSNMLITDDGVEILNKFPHSMLVCN